MPPPLSLTPPGRTVVAAVLLAVAAALAVAGCGSHHRRAAVPAQPEEVRTVAAHSECPGTGSPARGYSWPLLPAHEEHPIRGTFGEPRMIIRSLATTPPTGSAQFHQGVDIVGRVGYRVFAVTGGIVESVTSDRVVVRQDEHRVFQYYYVRSALHAGQHVRAGRTVIGRIKPEARHVHLTEIVDGRAVNPLLHLHPYDDRVPPTVRTVRFVGPGGAPEQAGDLHGEVEVIAQADDAQTGDVHGPLHGMPVAPALVEWRLVAAGGRTVVKRTVVADFRHHIPRPHRFWQVYAPETRQNFPVIEKRFHYGQPGRYDYVLSHALHTGRLHDGRYVLEVTAADECGNTAVLREPVVVRRAGV